MMGICHYKFVQTHRIYNVSEPYGLWVIMMCQKMFTLGKKKKTTQKTKSTILVSHVDTWGDYACVGQKVYGKYLYLPPILLYT